MLKDDPAFRRCIADKAVTRFKDRVRELTRRHRGVSLEQMIADLNPFVRGWAGYFGFSQWRELPSLDGWIRRRLRCVAWVQWKTRGQRYRELRRLKVSERSASDPHATGGPAADRRLCWRFTSRARLRSVRADTNLRSVVCHNIEIFDAPRASLFPIAQSLHLLRHD